MRSPVAFTLGMLVFTTFVTLAARADGAERTGGLAGIWRCTTEQNNAATKTVTFAPDGSFTIADVVTSPGGQGTIAETYAFDRASATWNLTSTPSPEFPFGIYVATAKPWTDLRWVFDGAEPEKLADGTERVTPVRMVYTDLFPAGFRHEFQVEQNGAWRDTSEEVCTR